MKLRKATKAKLRAVPSSVVKQASLNGNEYILLIILDGSTFVELYESNRGKFAAKLDQWTWENLDSLRAPVDCRFFIAIKDAKGRYDIEEHFIAQ